MDPRVYVYDFYGLDLNDPTRAPYYSEQNISRDTTQAVPIDNINIAKHGDTTIDSNGITVTVGKIYDKFGNIVVGIQENNATVVKQPILPLVLDSFNRPVKAPTPVAKTIG